MGIQIDTEIDKIWIRIYRLESYGGSDENRDRDRLERDRERHGVMFRVGQSINETKYRPTKQILILVI